MYKHIVVAPDKNLPVAIKTTKPLTQTLVSIIINQYFIQNVCPQVIFGRPFYAGGRPFLLGGRPNVIGGLPFYLGGLPFLSVGHPRVIFGRPFLFGGLPFLLGGRPLLFGGRPFEALPFIFSIYFNPSLLLVSF